MFVPTKEEVFTVLDQHADTLDGDVKSPLVLVGNEGDMSGVVLPLLIVLNLLFT